MDMSDERREALIAAGREYMQDYLNIRDEALFAIGDETSYEIDIADHADRVAGVQ